MDVEKKLLGDLRVVDLKRELEKRGLDKNGVKLVLTERLSKALIDEGHTPDSYLFEISSGKAGSKGDDTMNSEKGDLDDSIDNKDTTMEEAESNDVADGKNDDEETYTEADTKESAEEEQLLNDGNDEEDGDDVYHDETMPDEAYESAVLSGAEEDEQQGNSEACEEGTEKEADKEEKSEEADSDVKDGNEGDESAVVAGEKEEKTEGAEEDQEKAEGEADAEGNTEEKEAKTEDGEEKEKSGAEGEGESDANKEKKDGEESGANLWVSNLPPSSKATELKRLFSRHGKLVGAKIVTSARTPGARCYGYVTMANVDDAERCIEFLHRVELHGRIISVERAKDDASGPVPRSRSPRRYDRDRRARSRPRDGPDKKDDEKRRSLSKPSSRHETSKPRSIGRRTPPPDALSFDKIKEERERQRRRDIERRQREMARRREIEEERRLRDRERKQREEATRLDREKQRLRMERERLEREKAELLRLEKDRQRLESERLEREREELRKRRKELTSRPPPPPPVSSSTKRGADDKRSEYPSKRPNLDKDALLEPPPPPRFSDNSRDRYSRPSGDKYDRRDDRRSGKDDNRSSSNRYDSSKGDGKTWSNNGTQYGKSYSSASSYNSREVWTGQHWTPPDSSSRRVEMDPVNARGAYMGGMYTAPYLTQPPPPGIVNARYPDPRFDAYSHSLPVRKY